MINFFVETKSEYTTQLVNVLTPLVYEGIQSIYTESLKASDDANNILKVFQGYLKRIPKWNDEMIKQETDRIMNSSKSVSWLTDLVKATVKANIIVLTYNPNNPISKTKIDPKFYQNIKIEEFVHKIYLVCARELWTNPYLMYHQYPPLDLKRNQRDTIQLIRDSIREAIRGLLPVKEILELYLGEELEPNLPNDQFEKNITEVEERNIQKMIKKELTNDIGTNIQPKTSNNELELYNNKTNQHTQQNSVINTLQHGGNELELYNKKNQNSIINTLQNVGNEKKDLESRILEIINKTTSGTSPNISPKSQVKSQNKSSETSETNKNDNFTGDMKVKETIDDKIKNILEKNLGETDLNTSLSYRPETNEKNYQEIFSNKVDGNQNPKQNSAVNDTKEKDSSKSKRKFFNNYLNF